MDKVEDETDIDPVYVKGTFGLYGFHADTPFEEVKLDGHYGIKIITHEESYRELEWNIPSQQIYRTGRVLYRNDTEDILKLITLFCEYTYKDVKGVIKCNSVPKVLIGGTICPTRKELFTYNSKIFVAFGRYIFGYDANHVIMKPVDDKKEKKGDDHEDEEEYWQKKSEIKDDQVILSVPIMSEDYWEDEYVYSFMIYDTNTGILDAFGMYR